MAGCDGWWQAKLFTAESGGAGRNIRRPGRAPGTIGLHDDGGFTELIQNGKSFLPTLEAQIRKGEPYLVAWFEGEGGRFRCGAAFGLTQLRRERKHFGAEAPAI